MSARESWTKRQAQREETIPRETPLLAGQLNAAHRCDRCGAQAYVRVLLHTRQDLLFCEHHYRQHTPALAKVAVQIHDQTERLARADWPGRPS
jgi:4-hydroxyphenylpyruvate dioxygenase-like putative hemolysin